MIIQNYDEPSHKLIIIMYVQVSNYKKQTMAKNCE